MKPPIVTIKAGQIQGTRQADNEIAVFKGVPYAQPPVGDLRWRAPQPLKPWDGIKKTTQFSPFAWQQMRMIDDFFANIINGQGWGWLRKSFIKAAFKFVPKPKQSEDCLYLNVKTPSLDAGAKLPVMVWIHGGDHQDGSGGEPFYDGTAIPKKGIVLVTINYRLGLMGYFAHPELTKESNNGVSGNYGTLDQIAALKWVQENIAAFGGDPNNVTIFGESAGGESVAHMLSSPLAKGLFHKAILQSPANSGQMMHLKHPYLEYESAETRGQQFAEKVGISGVNQLAELRKIPAQQLQKIILEQTSLAGFFPVIDGYVLPKNPFETFYDGEQAKVPILLGSNSDEGSLLYSIMGTPLVEYQHQALDEAVLNTIYQSEFGEAVSQLATLYPGLTTRNEKAETDLMGDAMFGSKVRFYAEWATKAGQSVYFYFFKRVPPSPSQTAGAFHAAELPFVHGTNTPILPLNKADQALSASMINYWTQFAKTGTPNDNGLVEWETFDPSNPRWLVLDRGHIEMELVEREAKYRLLNQRTVRQIEGMKRLREQEGGCFVVV